MIENNNKSNVEYTFSKEDLDKIVDRLRDMRELIVSIDEYSYDEGIPLDMLEATDNADNSLLFIESLISARVNTN